MRALLFASGFYRNFTAVCLVESCQIVFLVSCFVIKVDQNVINTAKIYNMIWGALHYNKNQFKY